MANYRYLGYGITNEQGIAHLDHDANGDPITHSYTGTGAGELDIIASLDDSTHISDSSIQSETYSLWDTIFYDEGTSEPPENTWINSNFTVSYSDNGCLLTASQSFCTYFANMSGTGTSLFDWTTPFVVQFDVVSHVNGEIQLYDGTTNCTRSFNELGVTSNKTVKIVNDGTTIKYYVDGTEVTDKKFTATLGNCRVGFRVNSNNLGNITFKNFKIYNY